MPNLLSCRIHRSRILGEKPIVQAATPMPKLQRNNRKSNNVVPMRQQAFLEHMLQSYIRYKCADLLFYFLRKSRFC